MKFLSCLILLCGAAAAREVVSFKGLYQPDVRTAYMSRGKICENRPIQSNLVRLGADFNEFGTIGFWHWDFSALTHKRSATHHSFLAERDYGIYYDYDFHFTDEVVLKSEFQKDWVTLHGYRAAARAAKSDATLNEIRISQSLVNPIVTPFYLLRYCWHPNYWLYVRSGLMREFALGGGFTLTPQVYVENGNEYLFERRYGRLERGRHYHAGAMSVVAGLELAYRINEWCSVFASVQQFGLVSQDARRQTKASNDPGPRCDLTIGTLGMRFRF